MAINFTIDLNVPDGTQITISELDNHIRFVKRDEQERMDDSYCDTSVTSWTTTVSKQMKEGLARVHVSSAATKPTATIHGITVAGIKSNQLWVRAVTDTPVTAEPSFQYYDGAAWQHIKVGQDNILAGAITLAALPTAVKDVTIPEIVENTSGTILSPVTTWTALGALSVTYTPETATSIAVIYAQVLTKRSGGLATNIGLRLRKTTAVAATIAKIVHPSILTYEADTLIGFLTGVTGATTVRVEVALNNTGNVDFDGSQVIDTEPLTMRIGGFVLNLA